MINKWKHTLIIAQLHPRCSVHQLHQRGLDGVEELSAVKPDVDILGNVLPQVQQTGAGEEAEEGEEAASQEARPC